MPDVLFEMFDEIGMKKVFVGAAVPAPGREMVVGRIGGQVSADGI